MSSSIEKLGDSSSTPKILGGDKITTPLSMPKSIQNLKSTQLPNSIEVIDQSLKERRKDLEKLQEVRIGNSKDLVETQKSNSSWFYSSWAAFVSFSSKGTSTHENAYDRNSVEFLKVTEKRISRIEGEISELEKARGNLTDRGGEFKVQIVLSK